MKDTITLLDGYNGDTAKFYTRPLAIDGDLIKLQCAEPGKEYMIRWATIEEVKQEIHKAKMLEIKNSPEYKGMMDFLGL